MQLLTNKRNCNIWKAGGARNMQKLCFNQYYPIMDQKDQSDEGKVPNQFAIIRAAVGNDVCNNT